MASVVNFASKNLINRVLLSRYKNICLRCMSSESKDSKASNVSTAKGKSQYQYVPDFSKPLDNKNWVSYGFDYEDEKMDKVKYHGAFFFVVSVFLVYSIMFFAYMPDYEHRNWARREAFIRLHERETQGLEPIDPNYVDPSKVILPSDEELEDFEIIV